MFLSSVSAVYAASKKAKKKKKSKHKIEFVTKDKFILVGDYYIPQEKTDKPLIILVHSYAMSSIYWANLAEKLRLKGYNVVAMDLRGHGRSVYNEKLKFKSRYGFKASQWQKLPLDIADSINYIKNTYPKVNTTDTIMVGADIGAISSVLAANMLKTPSQKLVLISPLYEFKGLKMPTRTPRLNNSKVLILLSSTDKLLLNLTLKDKPIVKQYPKGGPGMGLIKQNPTAINDIVNFIVN